MKTVKKETPAVSTRRGQWHKHKCFTVTLVLDPTLKKLDSNTIRKRCDIIEKKKVRIEKKNADMKYFHSVIYDNFPRLAGQEFSLWRMSGDKPELVPLPVAVNNAVALCSSEELNRSHLYIKPLHATVGALDGAVTETTIKPALGASAQNIQSIEYKDALQQQAYNENDDVNDDDLPSHPAMVTEINSSQPEHLTQTYKSTHDVLPSSMIKTVYSSISYQHFPIPEQPLMYTTMAQSSTDLTDVVDTKISGTGIVENNAQLPDVAESPMASYTFMEPMSVGAFSKLLADTITPMQYTPSDTKFISNDAPASSSPVFASSTFSIDQIITNGGSNVPNNMHQVNFSSNQTDGRDFVVQSSHPSTSTSFVTNVPAKRLKTDSCPNDSTQFEISIGYQQASVTNLLHRSNDIRAISCGICLKNLPVEPVTLPCLDIFCLNCLQACIHETSFPSCPICQTYFHVPDGGLKGMPYNGFAEKVVELRQIANQEASDKLCEVCSNEYASSSSQGAASIPLAESYCLDCCEKFCKSCTKCHKSMKITRNHNLVDLGPKSSDQVYRIWKQKEQFCKNHMNTALNVHCHDCEQLVCRQCYEQDHSQHSCTFFDEMAEARTKQTLQSNTENLVKDISVRKNNLEVMMNDYNQREKDLAMTRERIKKKVAELKSEIDRYENELMLKCDDYQTNYINKDKSNLDQHEQMISKSTRLAGFMTLLKDLGSGFDLILFNPILRQKTNTVSSKDFPFQPDRLQLLEFKPSNVTTDVTGLIGLLTLKSTLDETCDTTTLQSQKSSASRNGQKIKLICDAVANQRSTDSSSSSSDSWLNLTPDYLPNNTTPSHQPQAAADDRLTSNTFVSNHTAAAMKLHPTAAAAMELNSTARIDIRTNTTISAAAVSNTIAVGHVALTSNTAEAAVDGKSIKENNSGCSSSLGILQLKLLQRVPLEACIANGMAEVSGRFYVCNWRSSELKVYDSKLCERLNDIVVKTGRSRLWGAKNISACAITKCLYILDDVRSIKTRIWRVTVEEAISNIWLSLMTKVANNLSVTSDGRVLLCYGNGVDQGNLEIYSSDALLLKIVRFPADMTNLWHAVESLSGNYIISGRRNDVRMITEVTVEGQVIGSFTGGADGEVNIRADEMSPVDEDGRVYFIDRWNDKVNVVDSTLSRCQLLLSKDKDDVINLRAVLYSRDNKQLIVLHHNKECKEQFSVYQVETPYSNSIF